MAPFGQGLIYKIQFMESILFHTFRRVIMASGK